MWLQYGFDSLTTDPRFSRCHNVTDGLRTLKRRIVSRFAMRRAIKHANKTVSALKKTYTRRHCLYNVISIAVCHVPTAWAT